MSYKHPTFYLGTSERIERRVWDAIVDTVIHLLESGMTTSQADEALPTAELYTTDTEVREAHRQLQAKVRQSFGTRWWTYTDEDPIWWAVDILTDRLAQEGIVTPRIIDDRPADDCVCWMNTIIEKGVENDNSGWKMSVDLKEIQESALWGRKCDTLPEWNGDSSYYVMGSEKRIIRVTVEDLGCMPRDFAEDYDED